MSLKKVKTLLPAVSVDMGGFPVKQPLPTQQVEQIDPFLLLHHAAVLPKKDVPAKMQGIGPHPHRGFSPVTFMIEGEIHHRDSRYNSQVAKQGEVQWMHAGMGIIHSERPSQGLVDRHGKQEIIQLWINSPAAKKMNQPEYLHLSEKEMPLVVSEDGLIQSKLVAGEYQGKKAAAKPQSPLMILWAHAKVGGKQSFQIPNTFNSALYLIKGKIKIEGYGIVEHENLIAFELDGNNIAVEVLDDAQFLVLSGAPINEKIKQYGPFVMNSQTEIMEAMRDYQMGKMGVLIEES